MPKQEQQPEQRKRISHKPRAGWLLMEVERAEYHVIPEYEQDKHAAYCNCPCAPEVSITPSGLLMFTHRETQ